MHAWRAIALAALVCVPLSGCAGSADTTTTGRTFERPITIVESWGVRVADRIDWHFMLRNGADARQDSLSLHLFVTFNQPGLPPDWAERVIPSMDPGSKQEVVLATPFHGFGDYSGLAEVWQGGFTVARGQVAFEQCAAC